MTAYYNENEPYAAQWLRNLIDAGQIARGHVDERDIRDVTPNDVSGYTQCHFFAGVGVWSLALKNAGWPDSRPVWTGSCPCQPFRSAGKGVGFDDERHLWPDWHHLIAKCQPSVVFGEQVASKDGLAWFDLVSADMEGTGYAVGAVDLCAAGVGAPHIRQRLWFVAEGMADGSGNRRAAWRQRDHGGNDRGKFIATGQDGGLVNMLGQRQARFSGQGKTGIAEPCAVGRLANSGGPRHQGSERCGAAKEAGQPSRQPAECGGAGGISILSPIRCDSGAGFSNQEPTEHGRDIPANRRGIGGNTSPADPGPTNGFWADADWLLCRDGKWRPVEPGTFPLAYGITNRVGQLRAYGNAIVSEAAQTVIVAYLGSNMG